ncbi:MAG: hypothetical protein JSV58_04515 [Candidatus Bathyarchaeota archaeon]|nr:MAG: hypothetical protein JSV58_04515 [Candidatus Bathyarchaeota archaeon]
MSVPRACASRILYVTLIAMLATSISVNTWQWMNPRIIEQEKTVDVEKIVEVYIPHQYIERQYLNRTELRGCPHFYMQIYSWNFQINQGIFVDSAIVFQIGEYGASLKLIDCEITNTNIHLMNLDLELEGCIVSDTEFTAGGAKYQPASNEGVLVSNTRFIGNNIFDIVFVNGTGNRGLENCTFNNRVISG